MSEPTKDNNTMAARRYITLTIFLAFAVMILAVSNTILALRLSSETTSHAEEAALRGSAATTVIFHHIPGQNYSCVDTAEAEAFYKIMIAGGSVSVVEEEAGTGTVTATHRPSGEMIVEADSHCFGINPTNPKEMMCIYSEDTAGYCDSESLGKEYPETRRRLGATITIARKSNSKSKH